jgi:hypothetical protein
MGVIKHGHGLKQLNEACEEASAPKVLIFDATFRSHDEAIGEEHNFETHHTLPGYKAEADIKQLAWTWCDLLRDDLIKDIEQTPMHLVTLTVSSVNPGPCLSRDGVVLYRLF